MTVTNVLTTSTEVIFRIQAMSCLSIECLSFGALVIFFPEYYWLEGLNNPYSFFSKEKEEGSFCIQQHCLSRVSVCFNL